MKVTINLLTGVAKLTFNVAKGLSHAFFFVQPRRHVLNAESL